MKLHELKNNFSKDSGKRLGRGHGSGKGKTSGRGHKGQKSRTGFNIPKRFEGGQTSLIQKLPKARGSGFCRSFLHILEIGLCSLTDGFVIFDLQVFQSYILIYIGCYSYGDYTAGR